MKVLAVVVRSGVPKEEEVGTDLKSIQAIVGGYVEHVKLRNPRFVGLHLWVNEMGIPDGLPVYPQPLYPGRIHGDFFVTRLDQEGETKSLTENDVRLVIAAFYGDLAVAR